MAEAESYSHGATQWCADVVIEPPKCTTVQGMGVARDNVGPEFIVEGRISYLPDGSIDEAMTYGRLLD